MAEFVSSPQVDPSAFYDPNLANTLQRNALANVGTQQVLDNNAAFRANAAGLASGDPVATGAALGADPGATTSFLQVNGPNQRASAASNTAAAGSLAAATLNAPADQRAAVYGVGRRALAQAGYNESTLPPSDYPGDAAMMQLRAQSLPVPDQLKFTPQPLSANPTPLLQSVPGGGSVGPGGVQGQGSQAGGLTATPLAPPGPTDPNAAGGPSPSYASRMMGVESGGRANAQNPMSSAGGGGQFIDSTWLGLLPQVRPDLAQGRTPQQQLALRGDLGVSTQMVNGYAQQNAPKLAAAGLPVNDTTLALAHRFGPDMAIQVASAPPGTPIDRIVGPQVMAVNPDLRGQTVGGIAGFYAQRVGGGAGVRTQTAANVPPGGIATDASSSAPPQQNRLLQTLTLQPSANRSSRSALPASVAMPQPAPAATKPPIWADPSAAAAPSAPLPPGRGYVPPAPTPDSPHDTPDPSGALAVDSMAAAAGLPFGTRVRLPDGSVQFTGNQTVRASSVPQSAPPGLDSSGGRVPLARADERFPAGATSAAFPASLPFFNRNTLLPASAPPAAPPMTPAQAVELATKQLGDRLAGMDPASANTLVQQAAQRLMDEPMATAPAPSQSAPPNGLLSLLGHSSGGQTSLIVASVPPMRLNALASPGQPTNGGAGSGSLSVANGAAPMSSPNNAVVGTGPGARAPVQGASAPPVLTANGLLRRMQPTLVTPGAAMSSLPQSSGYTPASDPAQPGALPPRAVAPQYPFARDRMTGAYVPVPEQPGFAYAIGPNNQPLAQMIPGAPGAGVETKVTPTGDVVTSNKSTGQYNVDRGVLPNTARIGQVNDGSAVHVLQPGSGEIGSFPLQANASNIQTDMYAEDRKSQAQQIDVAQQSQQQQVRLLEARQAMQGLPTGSGGEARAAWSNWAETYLPPAWATQMKAKLNLPDAVPAQEFAKLMTQSAGQQERAVAGARGGIGMMTLFKNNNPGLEMQPGANQDLLNAQLVATQADADYAKGYVNFVNDQGQKLVNRQGYTPASQFDQSWLQQRNPQVYTAAAEAMSGKPFAFWSKGLSPAEGRRALQIVGGIDPTVIAQGSAGPLPVRQFMGAQ